MSLVQELLDQSTAAMRSGQFFTSSLSRLEGDAVVIEARSFDPDVYELEPQVPVGARLALDDSIQKLALSSGTTRWWEDVALDPEASQLPRVRSAGCRALIVTPFVLNRETFFLTFWSREAAGEPFGTDDATYVELVAKLFAVRSSRSLGRIETLPAGTESEAGERTRLTGEISAALAGGEFELFYQPHVDLISGRVTGAEALIRWHHPSRGMLLPEAFIPFAERNGMIAAVSAWVIDNAIPVSGSFATIVPGFRLYLNLSALDLADLDVVTHFQRASDAGMHLENLGVEFTEAAAMVDIGSTTQIVNLLRALDVAVAIDDFGAGYASLGMLKRLPVDVIKIHHSIVKEILTNLDAAAITETGIGISRRLGAVMLGGGVETLDERTWLREHGCDYAQGYLIAEPLPVGDFLRWLGGQVPAA